MDIKNREDIELMVNTFYEKVKKDIVIGFIFTEIIKLDWKKHLPVMYNFWDTVILDAANYHNNTMGVHFEINRKTPLKEVHFKRWIELFTATVDELFEGTKASMAKQRAVSIADVMFFTIKQENDRNGDHPV